MRAKIAGPTYRAQYWYHQPIKSLPWLVRKRILAPCGWSDKNDLSRLLPFGLVMIRKMQSNDFPSQS